MTEIDLGIDELSDFKTIGTGGFSTVFSAWDEGFQRRVAVKLLHSLDEAGRRRFDRERAIMGQLSSHQNVITPFRAGYTPIGAPFFVMELVEGGSLEDQIVRRGSVPWSETLDYMIPATAALAHAHAHGILHRDVKPGNILLGTVPKLTDFGIAAIRESTASQIAYTLSHCPPETFARGQDTRDERSDLYSAASTIHTLITGRPPYDVDGNDSQQAYMFRIIDHEVPHLPSHLAPDSLRELVARTLAKDPAERPQSATELGHLLEQIRSGQAGPRGAPPVPGLSSSATATSTGPTSPADNWPNSLPTTSDRHGAMLSSTAAAAGTDPAIAASAAASRTSFDGPIEGSIESHRSGGAADPANTSFDWPAPTPRGHAPATQASGQPISVDPVPGALVGAPSPKRRQRQLAAVAAVTIGIAAAGGIAWSQLRPTETATPTPETTAPTTGTTVPPTEVTESPAPAEAPGPPPVAWTFETESSLASKPAVADGTLVIGAHVTNTVHAIDTETGAERWAFDAGSSVDAAPTIADGVVFVGSGAGTMHALGLDDGSVTWTVDLGAAIVSAALVDGDLVIVSTENGDVFALDRLDGATQWTAAIGGLVNSKPTLAARNGERVVAIGTTAGGLHLLDPATGEQLDRIALEGGVWFSNPLALDRLNGEGQEIWVGTSDRDRGFLNRVILDDGTVQTFQTSAGVGTDPTVTGDDRIVAGNDFGELFAVDRVSLGEVWREGYADANQIKGSPVIVGDAVIFGTHDKELIAVTAAEGSELWRFEGEQIFGLSAPVVDGDQLFVGNDSGTVYRFDLAPA